MRSSPTVSVVIPTYNSQRRIARALSSVLRQTLRPAEIIVVDDGSTDDTTSVVEELVSPYGDGLVKLVKLTENMGCYYARNRGWNLAVGDFIAFLDSDDSWHPRKLEIQATKMAANPDWELTVHKWNCLPETDGFPAIPENWTITPLSPLALMLFSCSFCTPSIMVRRGVAHRFDSSKRYSADRLFLLQMALHGRKILRLDLPLAHIHKAPYGAGGLSSHLWETEKSELHNFTQLRQMGLIGWGLEILMKGWSLCKYVRRICLGRLARWKTLVVKTGLRGGSSGPAGCLKSV